MAQHSLYGWHAVTTLLERHPERVRSLKLQQGREDGRQKRVRQLADDFGVAMEQCQRRVLDEASGGENHQGIVAVIKPPVALDEDTLLARLDAQTHHPFLLLLDGVTDPHNLGACLRTADAAGVDAVVVPKDNSAPLNGVAMKVASGAAESVPVVRATNLARFMRRCQEQGIWFTGTSDSVEAGIHDLDLTGPVAMVMGAEGKGMRRLTREHCDQLGHLPMAGLVSSLNVSVATGVCLFEAHRQRTIASGTREA
ncbi:23S rRNA (guanosine(2251)-2'-O)-methyltransferase RlmB [Salicola sp. Rm-C-2C1-2]|uniref:23S rRNA (guanosine(2251)-2'-O)-methyltransferase RlmB n=1 Tax=Salicola sp. Rm-C-2C1-2 TaxID=3141321 RepID=UPI0032E4A101